MPLNDPVPSTAADVLERNAQDFDRFVVSPANTFVNRLGVEKLTVSGINDVVLTGNPAVQAAQRAIDAAVRAENAEAMVDAANIKAEVDRAEAARDAAFVNADVYPDVATGLAAVADGEQFQVVEGSEIVRYRRDSATVATEVARFPSSNALANQSHDAGLYRGRTIPSDRVTTLYPSEWSNTILNDQPTVARSVVFPVVPGRSYWVSKVGGNYFRIATFGKSVSAGVAVVRWVLKQSQKTSGEATFVAEPGEHYAVLHVSMAAEASEVLIQEDSVSAIVSGKVGVVQSTNLFDGFYRIGATSGGTAPKYTTASDLYRSALINVEPGETYTVYRGSGGDRFRIALYAACPIDGDAVTRFLTVENAIREATTDPYTFTVQPGEKWLLVHVSNNGAEPELRVVRGGQDRASITNVPVAEVAGPIMAANITYGKNIFDGTWLTGTVLGGSPGSAGESSSGVSTNPGKLAIVQVSASEPYTIQKTKSNFFKIATYTSDPRYPGSAGVIHLYDNTGETSEITVTIPTGHSWMAINAALGDGQAPEMMQVERGSTPTQMETFGYQFSPHPVPYIPSSGVPGLDVDLSGGEDASDALNYYLSKRGGGDAKLPAGKFKISKTIYIPGETLLRGEGNATHIFLGDEFALDRHQWRGGEYARPLVMTVPGEGGSHIKGLRISGNQSESIVWRQFGLAIYEADHCLVEDVTIDHINYFPELAATMPTYTLGWNLVFLRSSHGVVRGGRYLYGGYENIGTETAEDILFEGVHAGVGWRTSVQFHRGSTNIRYVGGSIYQNAPAAHSSITLHGTVDEPVAGVLLSGLHLVGVTNNGLTYGGGIQTVEGSEHEVTIADSRIVTNNFGVNTNFNPSALPEPCRDWKISNTLIRAGKSGIRATTTRLQLDQLTIDAAQTAIRLTDENVSMGQVDFLNNADIEGY